jgi:hypothetical protein
MKKILVLVSLLIAAAACSNTPPGNKDVTANANSANANKGAETKSAAIVSESDIIAKEKAQWDAIKQKDWDGFGKMLASDYLEVLDDGVHDKAAALTGIKDFDLSDVTFADWKLLPIDKDAVIITYTATSKAKFKGEAVPPGPYREASVYVNRNGEWMAVFYQETLASTPPPPPPSPKATPPSKQAPSPMAKPGETGPDATANEKMVWDALKSKNYDAFGSYLASDMVNIQSDALHNKESTLKGVSMADFSKAQVGDWKTVKFDDDASLITYTVTIPGMKPEKEFHSTIWVKRDNKWEALFHQGTAAAMAATAKPDMKKM